MDDAVRNRLQRFLYHQAAAPSAAPRPKKASGIWGSVGRIAAAVAAMAILMALLAEVSSLQQEKQRLESALGTRDSTILQLGRHNAKMAGELNSTKTYLAETSSEVDRLDQQARALEEQAKKFNDDLHRFRDAYQGSETERGELIQRVLDLTQERDLQAHRSIPTQELTLAIREAVAARTSPANRRRFGDKYVAAGDNQGYFVREGRQTIIRPSTVWVRVHEPQAMK
jgi:septal ring factor EnvC (AmiA/AmiB activator)